MAADIAVMSLHCTFPLGDCCGATESHHTQIEMRIKYRLLYCDTSHWLLTECVSLNTKYITLLKRFKGIVMIFLRCVQTANFIMFANEAVMWSILSDHCFNPNFSGCGGLKHTPVPLNILSSL